MVARDMLDRRLWYKRDLEKWAFAITDETGRQVAFVPFANRPPTRLDRKRVI
jgi:hypothetical protein